MREVVSSRMQFLKLGMGGAPALPALSACGGGTLGQIEGGSGSPTLLLDRLSSEAQRFQRVVDQIEKKSPGASLTVGNIADGSAFSIKINTERVAKDLPHLQSDELKWGFLWAALEPFRLCHFESPLKASQVPLPSPD